MIQMSVSLYRAIIGVLFVVGLVATFALAAQGGAGLIMGLGIVLLWLWRPAFRPCCFQSMITWQLRGLPPYLRLLLQPKCGQRTVRRSGDSVLWRLWVLPFPQLLGDLRIRVKLWVRKTVEDGSSVYPRVDSGDRRVHQQQSI